MKFLIPTMITLAVFAYPACPQTTFRAIEVNPETDQVSLQWASQPATHYSLHYSTAMPSGFNKVGAINPSRYAGQYGDHSFTGGAQTRIQFLYYAADFPSVPASHRNLIGLAWRTHPDNAVAATVSGPAQVSLATTTATALTASYSQNIQASDGQVLVLDGMVEQEVTNTDFHLQKFEYALLFSKPFPYDPAEGKNLLVEFTAPQAWSHTTFQIDGWQNGSTFTLLGPAGLLRRWGFVTRFTFAECDGTLAENISSQGESTTFGPFTSPAPDASQLYFAVESNVTARP